MFCKTCGTLIAPDAKCCDKCGEAVAEEKNKKTINVKSEGKKKLPVILGIAAVLIIAIVLIIVLNRKDSFRNVFVNDHSGTVSLERKETNMEIAKDMKLIPKDSVSVEDASTLDLLVDDDKHIAIRSNTKFVVEATGSPEKGRVTINVTSGKTYIKIDNPLNENDAFQVVSPNATISVRGTIFTVYYDPVIGLTRIECVEGKVNVAANSGDEIDLVAGQSAEVLDVITGGTISQIEMDAIINVFEGGDGSVLIDDDTEEELAAGEDDTEEVSPEPEPEIALPVGEISDETMGLIFPGLDKARVAVALGGVNRAVFNKRSDYVMELYYLVNHTNFTGRINSEGTILELVDSKKEGSYKYYYYSLESAEKLFAVILQGKSLSEALPDHVENGMFVTSIYTGVVEDESPATPEYMDGYVDETGTVYIQMKNNYPSLYGDPAYSNIMTVTFIKGDDGSYVLDTVYKNQTITDLL